MRCPYNCTHKDTILHLSGGNRTYACHLKQTCCTESLLKRLHCTAAMPCFATRFGMLLCHCMWPSVTKTLWQSSSHESQAAFLAAADLLLLLLPSFLIKHALECCICYCHWRQAYKAAAAAAAAAAALLPNWPSQTRLAHACCLTSTASSATSQSQISLDKLTSLFIRCRHKCCSHKIHTHS